MILRFVNLPPKLFSQFRKNQILSARIASKIEQSMSEGRKIFRLFKFLDEVKAIIKDLRSQKPIYLRTLMLLSHISAFFFYILDNTLWAIKIGILRYEQGYYVLSDVFFYKVNSLILPLTKDGRRVKICSRCAGTYGSFKSNCSNCLIIDSRKQFLTFVGLILKFCG